MELVAGLAYAPSCPSAAPNAGIALPAQDCTEGVPEALLGDTMGGDGTKMGQDHWAGS